jgi:hypothetical protein
MRVRFALSVQMNDKTFLRLAVLLGVLLAKFLLR